MALFSVSLHLPPPGLKLQVLLLNSGPAAHHLKVNVGETSVGRKESLLYFGSWQLGEKADLCPKASHPSVDQGTTALKGEFQGCKYGGRVLPAEWQIRSTIILKSVMQGYDQHHCDCVKYSSSSFRGFQGGASGEEPACQGRRCRRNGFDPWVRKIPWKRAWQPTLVFSLGESSGQSSLAGCRELDTTEAT